MATPNTPLFGWARVRACGIVSGIILIGREGEGAGEEEEEEESRRRRKGGGEGGGGGRARSTL